MRMSFALMLTDVLLLPVLHSAHASDLPASRPASGRPSPVIFDTDIGGDIDDTWALAFLLACPELDLKLVVTAVENTVEKAAIVAKLLEAAGRTDVSVGIGIKGSDGPTRQAEWVKGYDIAKYPGNVHRDGVQAMIDAIMTSPRPVTLIAVGPVPNVAEALRREPRIAERARLVVMGGSIDHRRPGVEGPFAEYNVRADAKAAQAAYGTEWDVTMTPLDTAGSVVLRGEVYARVRDAETPLARAVMENYRAWAKVSRWSSPDAPASRSSTLFDTVAVWLAFANDFCQMQDIHVSVTEEGHTVRDPHGKLTHAALRWKDLDAFKRLLVDRIVGYTGPRTTAGGPGEGRVLFRTSFEEGEAEVMAAHHQVVTGLARTGDRCLLGETTRRDQAESLEIPFTAVKGHDLIVSFWARSEDKCVCSIFVRMGDVRTPISERISLNDGSRWMPIRASYPVQADTTGVLEIAAPSSWGAPAGKVWIDDLTVRTAPGLQWPEHVQDFPAIACDAKGRVWMAVLERPLPRRLIGVYRVENGQPRQVCTLEPEGLTGLAAPAVAGLEDGCVVAFPVEQQDRWRIGYVFVNEATAATPRCRFVESKGNANISPALAASGSGAWLLWESNAGDARGIEACRIERKAADDGTVAIQRLSASVANSYNPAIVALDDGTYFAAWDTIRDGSADIYGAWFRDGRWEPEQRITADARIERHPALAAWRDEVWMAWQAQSCPGRRINQLLEQRIVVARIGKDGLASPVSLFDEVSTKPRLLLRPRIAFDRDGRLWLTARESMGQQAGWQPVAWCYSGRAWSDPFVLADEQGRWRPVNVIHTPAGMAAACQYDNIPRRWGHQGANDDWKSGVALRPLPLSQAPVVAPIAVEPLSMPPTNFSVAERLDQSSADLPRQRLQHAGQDLTLYWGEFHEHTDLSICGRSVNPPGHDLLANVRDIERLDFCALTDHDFDYDSPLWQYNGEQTRYNHDPGRFVTFLGMEWTSSRNPPAVPGEPNRYGHHNVIYLDPYYGRYHDSFDGDISPADLWRQLEGVEFVCIPHQIADWQHKGQGNPPTDWNYVDERLQPVAEIFQTRGSYEYLGCPRQAAQGTPFKGYFLQDAWARGIVIGTIASPDHGGGYGKVGVWANELTRESVFRAVQARHTFGTSGAKMALFLRAGEAMMGDKLPRPPGTIGMHVRAVSRHPIQELVIFRNNEIVHRVEPGTETVDIDWADESPPSDGLTWYYARIHAEDNELAWSSPIWFTP